MSDMEPNSIDFIVTDPPYGLHFMGKDWDKFKKSNFDERGDFKEMEDRERRAIYTANAVAGSYDPKRDDEFQDFMRRFGIEALRVVKPGGHIAMFGSPRRHHRQMSGLEDAGWEIRDCIFWCFGQGFPKSHNFGKQMKDEAWKGYGTALKPAYEPIILAMKPLDGTFKENAEKWGVAGINIDESRISGYKPSVPNPIFNSPTGKIYQMKTGEGRNGDMSDNSKGRWPANLIFSEEAAQELDRQTGVKKSSFFDNSKGETNGFHDCLGRSGRKRFDKGGFSDSGGASRFFYCAKTSTAERNRGLEGMPLQQSNPNFGSGGFSRPTDQPERETKPVANHHPTVKPIALMKYIIKLLAPPGDPLLLDPFAGSGSTIFAAKELGIRAIGIELESEYVEIARKRLENTPLT